MRITLAGIISTKRTRTTTRTTWISTSRSRFLYQRTVTTTSIRLGGIDLNGSGHMALRAHVAKEFVRLSVIDACVWTHWVNGE